MSFDGIMDLSGRTLGAYQLIEIIGTGGMAVVYRARQIALGRDVAVKILPPHLALDPNFAERFRREVATIAHLEHAHIVPVHDYGMQEGITFVVMRLLAGGSLSDRLRIFRRPSLSETSTMLTHVASALDYAHSRGVIHRDVKPGNVLLDQNGDAYLADFGIAKLREADQGAATRGVGTAGYMAPEQALGKPLDGRADLYSLGVLAFHVVTGRLPFEGDTTSVIYRHVYEPPPSPREFDPLLPESIEQVLFKAMAKQAADRFQKVGDFAKAFATAIREAPETLHPHETTGFFTFSLPRPSAPLGATTADAVGMPPPPARTPMPSRPPSAAPSSPQGSILQRRQVILPIAVLILTLIALAVGLFISASSGRTGDLEQTETALAMLQASLTAAAQPTATPTTPVVYVFPSNTPSETATPTATATPSQTDTPTFTDTPTVTATPSQTDTPVELGPPGGTPVAASETPTTTATPSQTHTPTFTDTPTLTPTDTPTATATSTAEPTQMTTPTGQIVVVLPSSTPTPAPTDTPTLTATPTPSVTPTNTPTETPTLTHTPSATATRTSSPTATDTSTPTPDLIATAVVETAAYIRAATAEAFALQQTGTAQVAAFQTAVAEALAGTATAAARALTETAAAWTPTPSDTPTSTPTDTPTPSDTPTSTPTATSTPMPTQTPTFTPTKTPTLTRTLTTTPTVTLAPTPTPDYPRTATVEAATIQAATHAAEQTATQGAAIRTATAQAAAQTIQAATVRALANRTATARADATRTALARALTQTAAANQAATAQALANRTATARADATRTALAQSLTQTAAARPPVSPDDDPSRIIDFLVRERALSSNRGTLLEGVDSQITVRSGDSGYSSERVIRLTDRTDFVISADVTLSGTSVSPENAGCGYIWEIEQDDFFFFAVTNAVYAAFRNQGGRWVQLAQREALPNLWDREDAKHLMLARSEGRLFFYVNGERVLTVDGDVFAWGQLWTMENTRGVTCAFRNLWVWEGTR